MPKKKTPLKITTHLIRSVDFQKEQYNKVFQVLQSYDGPMFFNKHENEIIQTNLLPKIPTKKELLDCCDLYRSKYEIPSNDHVILLTSLSNSENWFSHFDTRRNIFIDCSNWNKYTKAEPKYPICYSIIENILQSLMGLEMSDIHRNPIGCMNDLCNDKKEILLKLRTADICEVCLKKMSKVIDARVVNHGLQIFEGIRNQFVFNKEYNRSIVPPSLSIDERGRIMLPQIGNLELDLDPILKTLYFQILKVQKLEISKLKVYKKSMVEMYNKLMKYSSDVRSLAKKGDRKIGDAEESIERLINPKSKSFRPSITKINNHIKDQLGKSLQEIYGITIEDAKRVIIRLNRNSIKMGFNVK